MNRSDAPSKKSVPFGVNGPREAILDTTPAGNNQASYDSGFPPITMILKSAGGLPPKGEDFNQILYELALNARWNQAGAGYQFDSTFSTGISGYPIGAIVQNSTGDGTWINTTDGNTNNPEVATATPLTGWLPLDSSGFTTKSGLTNANVTLTTLEASRERIVLSGTLTANINLIVPAWRKKWTVVNNCTGSFSVTIKTTSGTGIAVPAGMTAYVIGDGTNVIQDSNLLGISGRLIGAPKVFLSTGTYTPTPGTNAVLVHAVGGGGGGGGCAANPASQASGGQGGGAGAFGAGWYTSGFSGVLVTVGAAGTAGTAGGVSGVNDGGNGGTTSFGSLLSVSGGLGGKPGASLLLVAIGQSTTTNTATITGANLFSYAGDDGACAILAKTASPGSISGRGASSAYGKGAGAVSLQSDGLAASGRGAGGSGGISYASAAAQAGGAGTAGIVIIWEYA
ncbi:TPA: hypothetical protein QCK10_001435 [Enterobacter roggenkampii]|nr:hypothetical protein [Enterobacter roggenkampii]